MLSSKLSLIWFINSPAPISSFQSIFLIVSHKVQGVVKNILETLFHLTMFPSFQDKFFNFFRILQVS